MDQELQRRLDAQELKIDAIYKSVEKTRKYFMVMVWVTIGAIALPLLGLAFAIPAFLNNYAASLDSLGI